MKTLPLINELKKFMKPFPGPNPGGSDIRLSLEYTSIQEAFREDAFLPQGVWQQEIKTADWRKVEKLCSFVLMRKSKDLLVACWLVEAWINLYSLSGAKLGTLLLLKLTRKFWKEAYPSLNESDPEYRAAPYVWFNEKLSNKLDRVKITLANDAYDRCYTYGDYLNLQGNSKVFLEKDLKPTDWEQYKKDFEGALARTRLEDFVFFRQEVEETTQIVTTLQALLDEKLGDHSPSLNKFIAQLDKLKDLFNHFISEKSALQKPKTEEPSSLSPLTQGAPTSQVIEEALQGRSQAYAVIDKAADYLRQLDPHSPAPYLIKRAVRWGNLDFSGLLNELSSAGSSLEGLRHLLGIEEDPASSSSETAPPSP